METDDLLMLRTSVIPSLSTAATVGTSLKELQGSLVNQTASTIDRYLAVHPSVSSTTSNECFHNILIYFKSVNHVPTRSLSLQRNKTYAPIYSLHLIHYTIIYEFRMSRQMIVGIE